MQTSAISNPSERKKLIGALVLGLLAIVLMWWAFIGFGSSSNQASPTRTPAPRRDDMLMPFTSSGSQPIEANEPSDRGATNGAEMATASSS